MQSFGFAGTKDKRAITTQAVSVSGITRSRLDALALRLKGFSITNIVPSAVPVFLGDLIGNMFVIILRDVDNLPSYTALPSFINYFGLQRFGNSTIATHDIGKSLLASKFKEAVDLILLPRVGCEMNKAREDWQKNRSPKSAFDLFPRKAIAERAVLKFLMSEFQRKGGEESWDWCGAVVSVSQSTQIASKLVLISSADTQVSEADVCTFLPILCVQSSCIFPTGIEPFGISRRSHTM